MRNLTPQQLPAKRNPVIVDGQKIPEGEAPLKVGSQIQLGKFVSFGSRKTTGDN
ncbi:hypothetical protein QUA56_21900 [Microcoleus sp. N3A4]|uniref:hypothetical protein n=1 Tax=Microcoleus sp. N3A4 TaxID=3055379 RepID=UPI002FD6310A